MMRQLYANQHLSTLRVAQVAHARIPAMKHILTALLALVCTVSLAAQAPVRLYLKPAVAPGELVLGDDAKARLDSTEDLRKAFQRYGKTLVLVDDPAQAQLTVEVVSRGTVKTGNLERSTLPGVAATESTGEQLTVKLTTASGQTGEMSEVNKLQFSGWGGVAKAVAYKIQKWIQDNRKALLNQP